MKLPLPILSLLAAFSTMPASAQPAATPPAPAHPRALVELNTSYFPFRQEGPITPQTWPAKQKEIRERILLACGLFPLPTKTPLNAVIHGRVERDDYVIERVFFESFPGHYVTGNLYRPKNLPKDGKMPGILSPHGHWPKGRFMDNGAGTTATKQQLAIGAERWESGARSPLHARCVQLARMGCAVFFYDMLGYADSVQIEDHRSGRRPNLNGTEPGTFGLFSAAAELRLQSSFGLQTWNSVRALDFLLTIPGVDPTRLSITGESGGGTQSMILGAIDDRLATAFPCVMVSTAMQGGCTCENACYLRINQGNIDIAAAFAPKPMGLTAANDWTKELEKKGWPDLKNVWAKLGKPDNVMATFNIHWAHNYNHVSRTTMYGFMNKHFKLGFSEPVLEREFTVPTTEEITVWTGAHPKPAGDKVGGAHEKTLLKHWSDDSDRVIGSRAEVISRAWEIMIGRAPVSPDDVQSETLGREDRSGHRLTKGVVRLANFQEELPYVLFEAQGARNNPLALWLTDRPAEVFNAATGEPSAAARRLLDAGISVAVPTLYLTGAKEQPMNLPKSNDATRNDWRWSACYTYGYNPSLVAHRVHDACTAIAAIRKASAEAAARTIIIGSGGGGIVAAATVGLLKNTHGGAVIDTEGFRFASLNDVWDARFVPGAVKYGDVPGLLSAIQPLKPTILGEAGVKGGADAVANAVLKIAGK